MLRGGIRLIDSGIYSPSEAFSVFRPERVCVPMRQGAYPECVPCVMPGDDVLCGMIVGQEQKNGISVHSPVSGRVLSTGRTRLGNGSACGCVHIRNDFQDRRISTQGRARLDAMSSSELFAALRSCGLTGEDGPEYHKYLPERHIENILILAAGEQPGIYGSNGTLRDNAALVFRGARALSKMTGARVFLCVCGRDKQSLSAAKEAMKLSHVMMKIMPSRYPADPEYYIRSAAGAKASPERTAITGAFEAAAFAESIATGMPVTGRIVSVCGHVRKPCNLYAPLGTSAGDLTDFCDAQSDRIALGGVMTGPLCGRGTPVTLACAGISVLASKGEEESPCIRCGRCAEVCPKGLSPSLLETAASRGDDAAMMQSGAGRCTGCGCCSYVCPSRRRLSGRIFHARAVG